MGIPLETLVNKVLSIGSGTMLLRDILGHLPKIWFNPDGLEHDSRRFRLSFL